MKLKPGATLHDPMFTAALIVEAVYADNGFMLTITSGTDSKHGAGSLHSKGLALDFRTRGITPAYQQAMASEIRKRLGADYDCIVEADHIHIEHQPKGA